MIETKIMKRNDRMIRFASFTSLISSKQREHDNTTNERNTKHPERTKMNGWKKKTYVPSSFTVSLLFDVYWPLQSRLGNLISLVRVSTSFTLLSITTKKRSDFSFPCKRLLFCWFSGSCGLVER